MEYTMKFVCPTAYVKILTALHGTGQTAVDNAVQDAYVLQRLSAANAKAADCGEAGVTTRDMLDELRVNRPVAGRRTLALFALRSLTRIGKNLYPWDIDLDAFQAFQEMLDRCLDLAMPQG